MAIGASIGAAIVAELVFLVCSVLAVMSFNAVVLVVAAIIRRRSFWRGLPVVFGLYMGLLGGWASYQVVNLILTHVIGHTQSWFILCAAVLPAIGEFQDFEFRLMLLAGRLRPSVGLGRLHGAMKAIPQSAQYSMAREYALIDAGLTGTVPSSEEQVAAVKAIEQSAARHATKYLANTFPASWIGLATGIFIAYGMSKPLH